jgi:hypothetical protein
VCRLRYFCASAFITCPHSCLSTSQSGFPELKSLLYCCRDDVDGAQLRYPILVSLGATTGKARASTTRTHEARLILPLELVSACRSKKYDLEVVLWPACVLGDSQLGEMVVLSCCLLRSCPSRKEAKCDARALWIGALRSYAALRTPPRPLTPC